MIRFFSGYNPLNVIILFFLGILMKLPGFLMPVLPHSDPTDGFLYIQILQSLKPAGVVFPSLYPILAYLLLFTQAVTLNGLINSEKLFPSQNLLVAFAFLFVTSLLPEWNVLSPGLIINTVMVWVWPQMVGLYHNSNPKSNLFNLGFGFGICSFIYFPSVYFLVLLIAALVIFRPFRLTEWIIAILGVLVPFYFLLVYFFVWDHWDQVYHIIPNHIISLPAVSYGWKFWVLFAIICIQFLPGIYLSSVFSQRMVVHVRKSWSFMIFYLVVAICLPFINSEKNLEPFIMSLVPISIFMAAFYFSLKKKLIGELLIWLSFAWIAFNYFSIT